jgi:hypothetical protein
LYRRRFEERTTLGTRIFANGRGRERRKFRFSVETRSEFRVINIGIETGFSIALFYPSFGSYAFPYHCFKQTIASGKIRGRINIARPLVDELRIGLVRH